MSNFSIVILSIIVATVWYMVLVERSYSKRLKKARDSIKAKDSVWITEGVSLKLKVVTGILYQKGVKNGNKFNSKKVIIKDSDGKISIIDVDKVIPEGFRVF